MKPNRVLFHIVVTMGLLVLSLGAPAPAYALGTIITVDTTTNALGDAACSLQEAVSAANINASTDSGACPAGSALDTDVIHFDIGAGGPQTITLSSSVNVTDPVIID